jgi:hypothetical protein
MNDPQDGMLSPGDKVSSIHPNYRTIDAGAWGNCIHLVRRMDGGTEDDPEGRNAKIIHDRLIERWNAHNTLVAALTKIAAYADPSGDEHDAMLFADLAMGALRDAGLPQPDRKGVYFCAECDWSGFEDDVDGIENASMRISPGEILPKGQCPECGALIDVRDEEISNNTLKECLKIAKVRGLL